MLLCFILLDTEKKLEIAIPNENSFQSGNTTYIQIILMLQIFNIRIDVSTYFNTFNGFNTF